MVGYLTWGVDGFGRRLYLCKYCGEIFGYGLIFEDEIKHNCKGDTMITPISQVTINDITYTGRLEGNAIKLRGLSYDQCTTLAQLFNDRTPILVNRTGPVVILKLEMRSDNHSPGIDVTLEYQILLKKNGKGGEPWANITGNRTASSGS